MAHAIFRSDNLAGTTLGKYLVSVRMTGELDNGSIVVPGAYETGSREVRTYTAPAADSAIGTIAILGSEEVVKDVAYHTVGDFVNLNGSIARGYILTSNDVFSATAEAFDGTPVVGGIVELQAGYKMKAVATATADTTTIGECIAIEKDGATTWYVVRVA